MIRPYPDHVTTVGTLCILVSSLSAPNDQAHSLIHVCLSFAPSIHPFFLQRNESITGMQAPYAYVKLELHQEFDSLVEVTEIDPFDLAEIVGQIGGFWDLLLFSWPIFFVAISYEAPSLKARDFRKSAVRATENVTKVVLPTVLRRFRTGTAKRQSGRMCGGVETFEELPPWERSADLSCPQQV